MKIQLIIPFTIQRASPKVCDDLTKPYGILEVLDADEMRLAWAETEAEAITFVESYIGSDHAGVSIAITEE